MRKNQITKLPKSNGLPTSLGKLHRDILRSHERCLKAVRNSVDLAFATGRLLLAAREQIEHGKWAKWVEQYLPFSYRTARVYARLATHEKQLREEWKLNPGLTIQGLMRLLSDEQQPEDAPALPSPPNDDEQHEHPALLSASASPATSDRWAEPPPGQNDPLALAIFQAVTRIPTVELADRVREICAGVAGHEPVIDWHEDGDEWLFHTLLLPAGMECRKPIALLFDDQALPSEKFIAGCRDDERVVDELLRLRDEKLIPPIYSDFDAYLRDRWNLDGERKAVLFGEALQQLEPAT